MKYVQEISDIPVTIATWLFPIVQRELTSFASNLPVLFAQLIVVVFFTYYILIDGKEFMAKAVGPDSQAEARNCPEFSAGA